MSDYQKKIYLLTSYRRFFGQSRKPWVPLDTAKIVRGLQENGFEVIELEYHQAAQIAHTIHNSIIFYSFSQIANIRSYLHDLAHILLLNDNLLLPSYELLLCHENKGYQELYKQRLGFTDPRGIYLSSLEALSQYDLKYPMVLKTVDGSNANGVHLVRSEAELRGRVRRMQGGLSLFNRIDLIRRKHLRTKRTISGWENYHPETDRIQYERHISPSLRFVLQKFIPGLDCDYRVIVVWDKFYVSRRMTRKGDWRASGTKLFTYSEMPNEPILNFARDFFLKVGLPVLAMDLGVSEGRIHLFEFQASHFGISPIKLGPGYFRLEGDGWVFHKQNSDYETDLARGLSLFLLERVFSHCPEN